MIYFYYIITKTFQRSVVSDFTFGGLTSSVLSAFVIDNGYGTAPFHTILLHWDSTDYYGIMARTDWNFSFPMSYEMKFKAAIRGHHVYKATWSPVMNEVLICKKDNSNAVGVFKDIAERDDLELAGHVPIELSRVLACFLASNESNSLTVQVCGKLTCVASVSVWFRSKEILRKGTFGFDRARNETRAKKRKRGKGEGKEGNACRQTPRF